MRRETCYEDELKSSESVNGKQCRRGVCITRVLSARAPTVHLAAIHGFRISFRVSAEFPKLDVPLLSDDIFA